MNREEQRRLADIERRLRREDPQLADQFAYWAPQKRRPPRRLMLTIAVLWIICALVGVTVGSAMLVISGLALLSVSIWLIRRAR